MRDLSYSRIATYLGLVVVGFALSHFLHPHWGGPGEGTPAPASPAKVLEPTPMEAPKPANPEQAASQVAQGDPLLADLVGGIKISVGAEFMAKLKKASLQNRSGKGASEIAIFQLGSNRWNSTRLDLSKPYCLVFLNSLPTVAKARELVIEGVDPVGAIPSGFAGSFIRFHDDVISGIGCYQAALANRLPPKRALTFNQLKEVLGMKAKLSL